MENRDNPILRDILDHAASLPPEGRPAYVDSACAGDETLRAEVNSLLLALDQADDFLAEPVGLSDVTRGFSQVIAGHEPEGSRASHIARPGERIGPYHLLEKIGEGGMGVVFRAQQESPVRRQVALKIIKPGMDSAAVVARFEAERQALAMMDHANIARVFDAGTTDAVRPYFVMALVAGTPITQFCDDHRLTTRQRLELFIPVCRAIQHAHQKGIIHRDLKPTNVLIITSDGRPVPKVIDFGIAKALHQKLTEKTLFTHFGSMVGTLEYMSPEQSLMDAAGTDTRSDIYSLGVLVYELLTGSTPLDAKVIRQVGYEQMLRTIRELSPPKPSTRLALAGGEALASLSALRQIEPKKLARLVTGDLDWIVMKCLEKDRSRRYETATGLAEDIGRFLSDEPVEAAAPSTAYRVRKLARKYRRVLWIGTALFFVLMGATILSFSMFVRARNSAVAADQRLHQSLEMNEFMLEFQEHIDDWREKGRFLEGSMTYLEQLSANTHDPTTLLKIAELYRNVGAARWHRWKSDLLDVRGSLESYRLSYGILDKLIQAEPTKTEFLREKVRLDAGFGEVLAEAGRNDEAMERLEEGASIARRLSQADTANLELELESAIALGQLGIAQQTLADPHVAVTTQQQALAIATHVAGLDTENWDAQFDLMLAWAQLADAQAAAGEGENAVASALGAKKRLYDLPGGHFHRNPLLSDEMDSMPARIANAYGVAGHTSQAISEFRSDMKRHSRESGARAPWPDVGGVNIPGYGPAARLHANCYMGLSESLFAAGELEESLKCNQAALNIRTAFAKSESQSATAERDVWYTLLRLGDLQSARAQRGEETTFKTDCWKAALSAYQGGDARFKGMQKNGTLATADNKYAAQLDRGLQRCKLALQGLENAP